MNRFGSRAQEHAAGLGVIRQRARLAVGEASAKNGVLSAGEAFPAEPFLRALERLGAFTITL